MFYKERGLYIQSSLRCIYIFTIGDIIIIAGIEMREFFMKNMKKRYYYICLLIFCITSLAGCADDETDTKDTEVSEATYNVESGFLEYNGVNYEIDGENTTVAGHYDFDITDINIPDVIAYEGKDYPVTKVVQNAFESDSDVTSFTAGSNLEEIEDSAFYSCDELKTLDLADSVKKLGKDSFSGCSVLSEIKGVNALTSIADNAFAFCSSLESVTIPKSIENMGIGVFSECEMLKHCELEEGLAFIGEGAFTNCSVLSEVKLPDTITAINAEAFWGCMELESLELPESVVVIGEKAFYDTAIKSLKLPSGITGISFEMLDGMSELESIEVPESKADSYKDQFGELGIEIKVY